MIGTGVAESTPSDSKMASPIRVISMSHDVRFPDSVLFSLEAESDSPITEIRLFYNLESRSVQVYGYPDFEPDNRVSTKFSINTSGSKYIPAGVNFEYYYQITDSSGNTLETSHFNFAYRDPRYRWQEVRRGDLVVFWHNLSREKVESVVADVVVQIDAIRDMFELIEPVPMKAVIVNSAAEARRTFPFKSNAATRTHLYGGFAFGEYGLFIMRGLNSDTMVHEATHLLLDKAIDSPLARVPAWLNEGLATYFEKGDSSRESTLAQAERMDDLLTLRNMGAVPGKPREVGIFYAQAWSTVNFMVNAYGHKKMVELLTTMNDGNNIDEAVNKTYGITVDELEQRWKADLKGQSIIITRPAHSTVITAGMIACAVMIALAISIWHWIIRWIRGSKEPDNSDTHPA